MKKREFSFLYHNKRKLLEDKGKISHQEAIENAEKEFEIYRDWKKF